MQKKATQNKAWKQTVGCQGRRGLKGLPAISNSWGSKNSRRNTVSNIVMTWYGDRR